MENKLSKRLWLNIVIFSLMGCVAWNSTHSFTAQFTKVYPLMHLQV